MSDDPFAAFKEGQPPSQDATAVKTAKEKKPRNSPKAGKKKVAAKGKASQEAKPPKALKPAKEVPAKRTRKPRQAKEMRLPISMLLEIGSLSEEESSTLLSIGSGLQKLPKKSRQKISTALGKIFG